jgi:hypothetical protein
MWIIREIMTKNQTGVLCKQNRAAKIAKRGNRFATFKVFVV